MLRCRFFCFIGPALVCHTRAILYAQARYFEAFQPFRALLELPRDPWDSPRASHFYAQAQYFGTFQHSELLQSFPRLLRLSQSLFLFLCRCSTLDHSSFPDPLRSFLKISTTAPEPLPLYAQAQDFQAFSFPGTPHGVARMTLLVLCWRIMARIKTSTQC